MTMSVSVAEAYERWSEILDHSHSESVEITFRGRRCAVLVDPELYDRAMEALEDACDIADARAVLADSEEPVPWEDVQRDLNLLA